MVELTDAQAAKLYSAATAFFATKLTIVSAPKGERPALRQVAAWQEITIERVVAELTKSTFTEPHLHT